MDNWLTTNKPNWGSNWGAGDVMYKDLNGDGIVSSGANTLDDHGDLKRIGNATPRYRIGLNLDAAYKGFDFSIFFQGVLKRDWFFGAGDAYFGERKEICGKAPALKIIWTIGRKTILVHIIETLFWRYSEKSADTGALFAKCRLSPLQEYPVGVYFAEISVVTGRNQ